LADPYGLEHSVRNHGRNEVTNEELDNAREIEAIRIYDLEQDDPSGHGLARIAARLAREGWTPPVAVDPDLLELETLWLKYTDGKINSLSDTVLAGIKRGRELERAEAKPGLVWVKHDGSIESPIAGHHLVAALFKVDQYIGLYNAIIAKWSDITHYAIITQPEDVA
jgi:hypothetical protein